MKNGLSLTSLFRVRVTSKDNKDFIHSPTFFVSLLKTFRIFGTILLLLNFYYLYTFNTNVIRQFYSDLWLLLLFYLIILFLLFLWKPFNKIMKLRKIFEILTLRYVKHVLQFLDDGYSSILNEPTKMLAKSLLKCYYNYLY